MANSKLLKEAIADAKAVKETALANAKLALEEAFTPRLQSILSQKLRAEAEEEANDAEMKTEELDSTGIGSSTSNPKLDAHTEFEGGSTKTASGEPGAQVADFKKVADINEEEGMEMSDDEAEKQNEIAQLKARLAELGAGEEMNDEEPKMEQDDEMGSEDEFDFGSEEGDGEEYDVTGDEEEDTEKDDMDLEAIIRELEQQLEGDDSDEEEKPMYEEEESDEEAKNENLADGSEAGTDKGEDPKVVVTNEEEMKDDEEKNEVIDLEEILREMEQDMKKDDKEKVDEEEDKEEMEKELNEAYKTIKSLQKTINEVNLLNAKLLFANKLFRAHNMTNEQKVKVIETLDRTKSVREVKLVYSTLAENFKYTTSNKSTKKSISEGIASKAVKSTAPKAAKQVIAESADFSNRFKKLAGIIK